MSPRVFAAPSALPSGGAKRSFTPNQTELLSQEAQARRARLTQP